MNFKTIFDCFIANFKLKYKDSENITKDRVDTVVFNFHQINRGIFNGNQVGSENLSHICLILNEYNKRFLKSLKIHHYILVHDKPEMWSTEYRVFYSACLG